MFQLAVLSFLFNFLIINSLPTSQDVNKVSFDMDNLEKHDTHEYFLSVALDTSILASKFKKFNMSDERAVKVLRPLGPGYFRMGGNSANRYKFYVDKPDKNEKPGPNPIITKYNLTGPQLKNLVEKVTDAGFEMIFDLNVLLRHENNTWNYTNTEQLLNFSAANSLRMHFELGNEPSLMPKLFNMTVEPPVLAQDFATLRKLLNRYPLYRHSLIIGPDITRPLEKHNASIEYLKDFLNYVDHDILDVVAWHQYYFRGATATEKEFLNPKVFDALKWDIAKVHNISRDGGWKKQIWLGETSDGYSGGTPEFSNKLIGSFIWLDKLGIAARQHVDVVIRQDMIGSNYGLVGPNYEPRPSWWVSVVFKKLVGKTVYMCNTKNEGNVRLYCQGARAGNAFVVYGVNIGPTSQKVEIEGVLPKDTPKSERIWKEYVLTGETGLYSSNVSLNGNLLALNNLYDVPNIEGKDVEGPTVEMPGYSLAFWVIPIKQK